MLVEKLRREHAGDVYGRYIKSAFNSQARVKMVGILRKYNHGEHIDSFENVRSDGG